MYKNFENNIKSLISTAYPDVGTKEFYRWESINSFFDGKNIKLKEMDGYLECDQLRIINNVFKHAANGYPAEFDRINEFKNRGDFHQATFDFYERVKPRIIVFIRNLVEEIINDLYVFSEARLSSIVDSYLERMDEGTAEKLSQNLSYKIRHRRTQSPNN
ncbi:hypothetical protein [Larkinella humicola]|uniref:Uncharacterized protein n=1 Tax=Larkinella humicola TaxID=2607654 RepID=A0A5N1J3K3_9BACT|nr:hypothetical protein [Larkinella humicola]KAA9341149.1 hypothetical protein F0P93_30405 [Larkinella humicola]